MINEFEEAGITVVAASANSRELAEKTVADKEIRNLPVGYGLGREDAKRWGLFVSDAIKEAEPEQFVEPGLFLVQPDGTLYASVIQSMPFTRPPAGTLLKSIQWILDNDYPARGEVESSS